MDFKETGREGLDRIYVIQDRDQQQAIVYMVTDV